MVKPTNPSRRSHRGMSTDQPEEELDARQGTVGSTGRIPARRDNLMPRVRRLEVVEQRVPAVGMVRVDRGDARLRIPELFEVDEVLRLGCAGRVVPRSDFEVEREPIPPDELDRRSEKRADLGRDIRRPDGTAVARILSEQSGRNRGTSMPVIHEPCRSSRTP